jgi:hypothetical protein
VTANNDNDDNNNDALLEPYHIITRFQIIFSAYVFLTTVTHECYFSYKDIRPTMMKTSNNIETVDDKYDDYYYGDDGDDNNFMDHRSP